MKFFFDFLKSESGQIFLLALMIYYLQQRDAPHEFKSKNFFYIFVLLIYYRNF